MAEKKTATTSQDAKKEKENEKEAVKEMKLSEKLAATGESYGSLSSYFQVYGSYSQSLISPKSVSTPKVPTLGGLPSAGIVVRKRTVLTTSATGLLLVTAGVGSAPASFGSLIPVGSNRYAGCTNTSATMTVSDLFNGATDYKFTNWGTSADQIPVNFGAARLVSGVLSLQALGPATGLQGKMSGAFFPKRMLDIMRGAGTFSVDALEKVDGAAIVPVNSGKPIEVYYRPVDGEVLAYVPTLSTMTTASVQQSWFPGACIIAVTEAAASAQKYQMEWYGNYEMLPSESNASPYSFTPSVADTDALQQGLNVAARMPSVRMGEDQSQVKPIVTGTGIMDDDPAIDEVAQERPMMESMIETLSPALDMGLDKAADLASEFSKTSLDEGVSAIRSAMEGLF